MDYQESESQVPIEGEEPEGDSGTDGSEGDM
jgi:hypothetical protein